MKIQSVVPFLLSLLLSLVQASTTVPPPSCQTDSLRIVASGKSSIKCLQLDGEGGDLECFEDLAEEAQSYLLGAANTHGRKLWSCGVCMGLGGFRFCVFYNFCRRRMNQLLEETEQDDAFFTRRLSSSGSSSSSNDVAPTTTTTTTSTTTSPTTTTSTTTTSTTTTSTTTTSTTTTTTSTQAATTQAASTSTQASTVQVTGQAPSVLAGAAGSTGKSLPLPSVEVFHGSHAEKKNIIEDQCWQTLGPMEDTEMAEMFKTELGTYHPETNIMQYEIQKCVC